MSSPLHKAYSNWEAVLKYGIDVHSRIPGLSSRFEGILVRLGARQCNACGPYQPVAGICIEVRTRISGSGPWFNSGSLLRMGTKRGAVPKFSIEARTQDGVLRYISKILLAANHPASTSVLQVCIDVVGHASIALWPKLTLKQYSLSAGAKEASKAEEAGRHACGSG